MNLRHQQIESEKRVGQRRAVPEVVEAVVVFPVRSAVSGVRQQGKAVV